MVSKYLTENDNTIGVMNCNIVMSDDCNVEDKQNMSVILVPENVLQALSNSTYNSSDLAGEEIVENDQNSLENDGSGDSEMPRVLGGKSVVISNNDILNLEGNLNDYLLTSPHILVLDSNVCVVGTTNNNISRSLENEAHAATENDDVHPTTLRQIKPHPMTDSESLDLLNKNLDLITQDAAKNKSCECDNRAEVLCYMGDLAKVRYQKRSSNDGETQSGKDSKYKCKIFNCYKTFNTLKEFKDHSAKHTNRGRHECNYPGCPWSFPTPYKLKRHLKSHDQIKQHKCTYEGCDISCSTKYNLQSHINMHKETAPKKYCHECKKSFIHFSQLRKHMRTDHNAAPKYECTVKDCNKMFHTTSARNTHAKSHAAPVAEFVCCFDGCGKRFERRAIFKEHLMMHSNIKPFKCEYPDCDWAFTTRGKLNRHDLETHKNNKRYQCPVENCASRFCRLEHIKAHLKVHMKCDCTLDCENATLHGGIDDLEAPNEDNLIYYLCPYEDCGSLFSTLIGAKQHIQKIHTQSQVSSPSETEDIAVLCADNQPVSITLEAMMKMDSEDDIPDDCHVVVSDDAINNEKNTNPLPATESLLGSMLRSDSNIAQSSERIMIDGVTSLPSVSQYDSIAFIDTISNKASREETIELTGTNLFTPQGVSPTTIDPSQFLLGGSVDYSSPNSEAMKYINIPQYPPSSSTDRFLNFNECVSTVDPNMVMPISSLPAFRESTNAVSQSYDESSDEDDPSSCDENNNTQIGPGSGAARTDCHVYRKTFICTERNSPSAFVSPLKRNFDSSAASSNQKKLMQTTDSVSDFDTAIESFMFSDVNGKDDIVVIGERSEPLLGKRSRISDDRYIKESHSLRGDFTGSTINLNDLA